MEQPFGLSGIIKGLTEQKQHSRIKRKQLQEQQASLTASPVVEPTAPSTLPAQLTSPAGSTGNSGGNVGQWLDQGAALAGIKLDPQRRAAMLTLIKRESGGNPRAINNWDSNAKRGTPSKGLLQTIDPTFNSYKVSGYNDIYNPVHNVAAALRYIQSRYGDIMNVPSVRSGKGGY